MTSRVDSLHTSATLAALTSADTQFPATGFDPELKDWSFVEPLIVGAGGIGCELLHLLALSGFAHLTVIDMDYVELSNLNRQFLFTHADVGKAKSTTAAVAVQARCPGVSVTAVVGRLEDQSDAFYRGFDAVLLAVDSIPARRWINQKIAELATRETAELPAAHAADFATGVHRVGDSVIKEATPIFDTGTEGFEGHCRVIAMSNNRTPCIECEMYLYNNGATRATVPLCTLESVPRAPEHCVLYVQIKEWPELYVSSGIRGDEEVGDAAVAAAPVELDPDNPDHVHWIAERARARQAAFGIGGPAIDDMFTLGVIKNVVPAVGFTNALVAGQAVTELMKWLTGCGPALDNFVFYNGATPDGIYALVESCFGSPMHGSGDITGRCLVCGPRPVVAVKASTVTAAALREALVALLVPAADRAALHDAAASLLFTAGNGELVEVPLTTASPSCSTAKGEAPAAPAAAAAAAGGVAVPSLAEVLVARGHADFVRSWEEGSQTATVDLIGSADSARLSVIATWAAGGGDGGRGV